MLSLDEIRQRCAPVFEESSIVLRAFVFGSYARGEQEEGSDVDICYDRPDDDSLVPHGLAMFDEHGKLRRALENALGLPVDLLPTPNERMCSSRAQKRFVREVMSGRKGIYERA